MDAPTTPQEIKAAYKALYNATANALDAQRTVNAKRYALKDAEATLTTSGALEAGKNAETRAAILTGLTGVDRLALRLAEEDLAAAEREQALAKIVVNELRELMRLAELESAAFYRNWPAEE